MNRRTLVLDASVALKWFFQDRPEEPGRNAAATLLEEFAAGAITLLQPPHFLAEVCAVLARESPATVAANLRDLLALGIEVRSDGAVYARAMELSARLGHHLFDTLYHAVALETPGGLLVTADETYWRKAAPSGAILRLGEPLPVA